MTTEENKANSRRFLDEVLNRGNLGVIDELMARAQVRPLGLFRSNEGMGEAALPASRRCQMW